VGGKRDREID
jgi:hypothetical protein